MKKNKFEDSPKDEREDKSMAKKLGMSKAAWERTAANKKHDTEGQKKMSKKKMAMGGPAYSGVAPAMGRKSDMMPPRDPRQPMPNGSGYSPNSGKSDMMPPRDPRQPGLGGSGYSSGSGKSDMMPPRDPRQPGLGGSGYSSGSGKSDMMPPRDPRQPGLGGSGYSPGSGKSDMMPPRDPRQPRMKSGGKVSSMKKMASGGAVRGSGCAVRGVKKAKSY